jgi:hypothetical protein
MTSIVGVDYPQPCGDSKIHHLEEWIPVSRPVQVEVRRLDQELADGIVGGPEIGENPIAAFRERWLHPARCAQTPLHRRLERVDEQRAEESRLQRSSPFPAVRFRPFDSRTY